jgi:hypothetical protein
MVAAPILSTRGRRGRTKERSEAAFAALLAFLLLTSVVALAFIGTGGLLPAAPPSDRTAALEPEAGPEVVAVPQEAENATGGQEGGAPAGTSGSTSVLLTEGFLSGSDDDDDTIVGVGSGGGFGSGQGGGGQGGGQGQGGGGGASDQTGGDTGETVARETGETVVVVEDGGTDAAPPARGADAKPPKPPRPASEDSSEAPDGSSEAPGGKALGHAKEAESSSGSGATTPPGHSKARGAGHTVAPGQGHEKHH